MQQLSMTIGVSVLVVCTACTGRTPPELDAGSGDVTSRVSQMSSQASVVPALTGSVVGRGFVHDPVHSKSPRGDQVVRAIVAGVAGERISGSEGVFHWDERGFSTYVPSSGSSAGKRPPLAPTQAHESAVLDYFMQSGLPSQQVGEMSTHTIMEATGYGSTERSRKLTGYVTVVGRRIGGIRVADSHAWAQFNVDGVAVAEHVWWPAIPSIAFDDASDCALALQSAEYRRGLSVSRLHDLEGAKAEVVIHHSSPIQAGAVTFEASIDLASPKLSYVVRVDKTGAEIVPPPSGLSDSVRQ